MEEKNEIKFNKNMDFNKKPVWCNISTKMPGGEKINIRVLCSDSRLISYILGVLNRLPDEDVKHLALEKNLTIIQSYYSTVFQLESSEKPRWILYLYDNLCDAEDWYIVSIIAHELAHIYLNHDISKLTDIKYLEKDFLVEPPEQDVEADKQVKRWGFERELKRFQSLVENEKK